MDDDFRYRVNYSENIAPKYPAQSQEGLEVVPSDSPLYAVPPAPVPPPPPPAPLPTAGYEKWASDPREWGWADTPASAVTAPEDPRKEERRRILGLTVPIFWTVVVIIVVVLAAAIGGGIGGGLKAQQDSNSNTSSDAANTPPPSTTAPAASGGTASPTSSAPNGASSTTANAALPSDGGCPQIEGQTYTPYAVDGNPIPLEQGLEPQEFTQHCYTNFVSSTVEQTHDILKIFMPTLENCMMTCASYNAAYRANLNANVGVGGGYCVGVTLEKFDAGFCYLKSGTSTNDTMGRPDVYSSAVLLTDLNTTVSSS
ncbi:hypothetical protein F4818DRAFT_239962 [Hypoxylon cercidicola]|nr:hypothetical protein F4818DRAFT_239962 [Hypoxylon cercidicola]